MRLNDILTERQQNEMHMLQEGPLGSLVRAAGRGVGNVIGGVATGIGAVKGAVKGAVDRAKTSFAAGQKGAYDAVAGKPAAAAASGAPKTQTLANPKSPPAGGTTPPAGGTTPPAGGTTPPAAGAGGTATPPASGAGGTATPPAGAGDAATPPATPPAATPAATPAAADKPPAAVEPQPDAEYDKTQKAVDALPDEQKKEIIGLLQADPKVKAAMAAKPSTQGKKGVSQPGKPTFTGVPEKPEAAPAAGGPSAAGGAATPPAAGAGGTATPPAAGAAKLARTGGKVAGQVSQTPGAIAKRAARADKKKPAGVGLDMNLLKAAQQNASRVNLGTALSEMLARRVAHHKRNMFESQLDSGTQSIFRQKK